MTALHTPLVERVADAIESAADDWMSWGSAYRSRLAQAAIDACHAAELAATLREYIAAADDCVSGDNDVAAMLRFGAADKRARALLTKLEGR